MSNIEFDEIQSQSYEEYDETPKIVGWVIKYSGGLVKGEKQAQYFLLGVVVVFFIFTLFFLNKAVSGPAKPPKGLEGDIIETYDSFE